MTALDYPHATPPAPATALAVAPGIGWLRMPLPFALDHINLWIVDGEAGPSLVDTGYGDDVTRSLWDTYFASTGERSVEQIVVTHYHPDHVGNAAWLAHRFGVTVAMTAAEYLTGHAVHAQIAGYATGDTCALFRAHGVDEGHVEAMRARGNRYRAGVPELPTRYRRMHGGTILRIGDGDWRVIAGFGHSPEHAALYSAERRVLVSGDMLLPRISTNVSVWPAEPEGDPLASFLQSLAAFEALPDDTLVLPSHGLPFRGIAQRVAQLRDHHAARLHELVDGVPSGGATAADIVPILFRRELDAQQRFFAVGEAIAHLNHLVASGTLDRERDAAGRVRFTPRRRAGRA